MNAVVQTLTELQWIILVLSALLLFLYGLEHFSKELQNVGGDRLPRWLGTATQNRVRGLMLGAGVTAVVQSSSAVSALVVALVNSGALSFSGSLAVMLGAKIGTTSTAWLVSFNLTHLGPALIVLGGFLTLLPFSVRVAGRAIFYFGFILFALDLIGTALAPLRHSPTLLEWLTYAQEPTLGILIGIVMTVVLQSSSVVSGLAIVLVQSQVLDPQAAVAIVVGATLGTTTTALIASLPMNTAAQRAAQMNLLFNAVGVVLMWPFMRLFAQWAVGLSESPDQAVAIANLAFNAGVALLFLPFTAWLAAKFAPKPNKPASRALL